ncbi:MAG: hypothetical protein ACIAS6_00055 [Phycisphaerales bacterium JB060]
MIDDRASTIDGRPVTGQIGVEGSDCMLYLPELGQPEGERGVLFTLVRCVRNEFDQERTSPRTLIAAITTAMTLARQRYVVDELRFDWGPTGANVIQEFSLQGGAPLQLASNWHPADWWYYVRSSEQIDAFSVGGQPLDELHSAEPPAERRRIVVEAPKRLVLDETRKETN